MCISNIACRSSNDSPLPHADFESSHSVKLMRHIFRPITFSIPLSIHQMRERKKRVNERKRAKESEHNGKSTKKKSNCAQLPNDKPKITIHQLKFAT